VATATAAAGEAGNDDVEETDNGVDDSGQHGADAVDDGHQAVADGAEDGFELELEEVSGWICGSGFWCFGGEFTQETTAPILMEWWEGGFWRRSLVVC
jgi:hypothetical protein